MNKFQKIAGTLNNIFKPKYRKQQDWEQVQHVRNPSTDVW
jgi:hypothetical protein